MNEQRPVVMEAIAYGDDPALTPGDRLRALELLREPGAEDDKATLALTEPG